MPRSLLVIGLLILVAPAAEAQQPVTAAPRAPAAAGQDALVIVTPVASQQTRTQPYRIFGRSRGWTWQWGDLRER